IALIFSNFSAWSTPATEHLPQYLERVQEELASRPASTRIVALGSRFDQLAHDERVSVPITPLVYLDEAEKSGIINSAEKKKIANMLQGLIQNQVDLNSLTLADFNLGQPPQGIRRAQMGVFDWASLSATIIIVAWIASSTFKYYQAMLKERAQLDKQTQDDILRSR